MSDPLLTVLMPVYNAEKYLAEAIDSILNQTLAGFELLIVNDASTDRSVEIINSYQDPRIRLISNDHNLGISATLNKGLEFCTTELVARMDADDISYPSRLEKQYDFFLKNPGYSLLATWAREVTADKQPLQTEKMNSDYHYYVLTFQCCIYHPTVMYKRSAVIDVGLYNTPYSEDFEMWWQLTRRYKVACLHEPLLDYRISEASLCRVTKRSEYETAQYDQVVRNIHYYTGYNYQVTYNEVECFRFNCEPLLNENSVDAVIVCLDKLSFITKKILAKENINLVRADVLAAAAIKRESVINYFSEHFSFRQYSLLLLKTGSFKRLAGQMAKQLFRR